MECSPRKMKNWERDFYEQETQRVKDSGRVVIGKIFQNIDEGGVSTSFTTDETNRTYDGKCEVVVLVQHYRAIRKYHSKYFVKDDEVPHGQCWEFYRFIGECCIAPIFQNGNGKFRIAKLDAREQEINSIITEDYYE